MPLSLNPSIRARAQGQQQNTQAAGSPAPIRGLMANIAIYGGDTGHENAIWLYNFVPRELGCSVRKGSREHATNIPDSSSADGDVRTISLYNSQVSEGSGGEDFLFAFTDSGIYDITVGGEGPHVEVLAWPVTGGDAGWVSVVNYTNVAGDHFLLIADEGNGYYIFDGTVWAAGTFTGAPKPLAADLVHITEWQGRIWFVERDTARAWFLDPLALAGDITPFDVGSRFKKGGHLVQNGTWTLDDGAGMNDRFVQISSAGDVLVWTGTDPTTAADMTLLGRWYIGKVPEGRRVMTDWGGDVALLSHLGMSRLSALLGGEATLNDDSYITKNISRYIAAQLRDKIDDYGWQIELNAGDDVAIISVPSVIVGERPIQFVLNTNTKAWCTYRDLDMLCMSDNNLGFFFGTQDGRAMVHEGTVDDAPVTPAPYTGPWSYVGVSDLAPPVGEWAIGTSGNFLTVNKTDGLAADRTVDLMRTAPESRIQFTQDSDTSRFVVYNVEAAPVDDGTHVTYNVTKRLEGAGGVPLATEACTMDVTVASATLPKTINYSMLSHYSHMGTPAQWKRAQFIRPSFIGKGQPIYGVQARYDFDLSEVGGNPPYLGTEIAQWDNAIWDVARWSATAQSYIALSGLRGMGRHIAIALRGESATELSLIGFDLMFDNGGML